MAAPGYKSKNQVDSGWWDHQIKSALEFRKKYAREGKWDTWRDYYRGEWEPTIHPQNLFYKMLRTVVPRVYFRNPEVSITPQKPGVENAIFAHILERVDNKLLRQMHVKNTIKRAVQHAFMFGVGFGKLGYGAQFTPTPEAGGTVAPSDDYNVEYHSRVVENMPWFLPVHTGNILVPDGLDTFDATPWVIHHIIRPIEDVKADPRFKNTKDLKPTKLSQVADNNRTKPASPVYRPIEMIDLYEIRDKRTGRVLVLAQDAQQVLYNEMDEFLEDGFMPIYPLVFNEDDEVFWATSDSQILDPTQVELNETETLIMKHRRLSIIRLLYKQGAIDENEVTKMVSETVMPAIRVNGDPERAIKIIQSADIPRALLVQADRMLQEARENVGFGRNQFGEYNPGSGDTTAFEASVVQQASEIRIDERRDMVADMLVEMVKGMHKIIFRHWRQEQVIQIAGPMGAPVWVQFQGEMLAGGRYEVNVDPDSGMPQTRQMREAKALKMHEIYTGHPLVNQNELVRYTIGELNSLAMDRLLLDQFGGVLGDPNRPINVNDLVGAMGQMQQAPGNTNQSTVQEILGGMSSAG